MADELQQKSELLASATVTIAQRWKMLPDQSDEQIYSVRYALPDGRWEQPQISVAETHKGWRIINIELPEFKQN
ncbi:MAG TPA: hypothetical protein VF258_06435 [Luteolibacter sp.]